MLILAAALAAGATPQVPPRSPAAAMVEARATARIIAGVRVHLGQARGRDGFVVRASVIRSAGAVEPARLIEFE